MPAVRVEFFENLGTQQKKVNSHCNSDHFRYLEQGFVLNLKLGELANQLKNDDAQSRSGAESRCQKTWGQDGRIPEGPRSEPVIKIGGDGVNGDGSRYGKKDERHIQPFFFFLSQINHGQKVGCNAYVNK